MCITGPPGQPTRVGVPIADLLAGMYGAFGVLAALLERARDRPRPGRAHVPARRRSSACTPSRAPAGRWPDEVPQAQRQPPPVDRAVRAVPCSRRCDPGRGRQRGAVADVRARRRARPARTPGSRPTATAWRTATSCWRRSSRARRAPPRPPGWTCSPRLGIPAGQGPHARRGVRVGPDPLAGAAHRRRPPGPWPHRAARVRRCASTTAPTPVDRAPICRRRGSASTTSQSGPGWPGRARHGPKLAPCGS